MYDGKVPHPGTPCPGWGTTLSPREDTSTVRIIIDTTQPITDTDRAILTTLLGGTPHKPTPTQNVTEQIAARVAQATKPPAAVSDAKRPVTQQAGVRTRESTTDDT